ncbi:DUF3168 domain-containing protein [Devosia sp. ZB163]|uniref:DUF3168 domain-containing protein n=1 Tax=Devosia sp. ZB163 TaxID=3025938 RepID=UPI0023624390|nr:DUF3168 domain-containing protein [Devosia sp. ZB163]MDC9823824.1 DUF3168 domain-containing protein [Devosia sp. ZB163]
MTHPIIELQSALVANLRGDPGLAGVGIFDAPPQAASPPYVAIARHDLLPRDGDVTLHVWAGQPSRKAALAIAERVVAVAEALTAVGLAVTHIQHERTDTAIDGETGQARAAVAVRFFSEPVA